MFGQLSRCPASLQVTACIVTCGGLCPGLNDVVAGIVNKLTDYGVPEGKILGIKYGFRCDHLVFK